MADYSKEEVVSIGSWIGTYILMCIPLVNIIYVIVLLCGGGNKNKVNMVRAWFVLILISIVIAVVLSIVLGAAFSGTIQEIIAKIQETINSFGK